MLQKERFLSGSFFSLFQNEMPSTDKNRINCLQSFLQLIGESFFYLSPLCCSALLILALTFPRCSIFSVFSADSAAAAGAADVDAGAAADCGGWPPSTPSGT